MAKTDDYKTTKEYIMWGSLKEICDKLRLRNENDVLKIEDMNEFWEPLLDGIFKMGVFFKQVKKLKEIKVDWIRPIFYIKTDNFIVMDGKRYEDQPLKEAMSEGQTVNREFQHLVSAVQEFDKIENAAVWKKMKTSFQRTFKDFFDSLNNYIKNGYIRINANIKDILRPLLIFRKANYHLFLLEAKENNDAELSLFQDRKDVNLFVSKVHDFFETEEFKNKKDAPDLDRLSEYLYKNITHKSNLEYYYTGNKREDNSISLQANKFRKDALQKKFEEGLDVLLKYLYDKMKEEFSVFIDVHKLFTNINILSTYSHECIKFYLDKEKEFLREMKIKTYEMKINGLSRIKMPITKNEELIEIVKNLYNMHITVEYLMGDKLKFDQYVFFYQNLKFIHDSSIKGEMDTIKNKEFMEGAIPKFLILSAMRQAASILEKMRIKSLTKSNKFVWDEYYQIDQMPLEVEGGHLINAFELNENSKKIMEGSPELKLISDRLESEIKEFGGRFWILEGFFPIEDRKLWLEGIDILRNINTFVIDDIRDYILSSYNEIEKINNEKKMNKNTETNSNTSKLRESKRALPILREKTIKTNSNTKLKKISSNKGLKKVSKNNLLNRSYDSDDDSLVIYKQLSNVKLENLRPPYVWNYPIDLHRKKCDDKLDMKGDNRIEIEDKRYEVRNIDPASFYKDGRVKTFMDILNKIKENVMIYSMEKKSDKFKVYFEKTLSIWNINYVAPKKNSASNLKKEDDNFLGDISDI